MIPHEEQVTPELNNPQTWPLLDEEAWVSLHVPRFARIQNCYRTYEVFLRDVLKGACSKTAPLSMVEARAKGLASFAEKILRKRAIYIAPHLHLPPDPLLRLTDLCGARVIVQTSTQVKDICRFIEQAFDIDWDNSEDVSQRLKPSEFGYRSVHYIVSVNPDKLRSLGLALTVPPELLGFDESLDPHACGKPLKAEIQVRTFLEHAWSDIAHDLAYKSEYKVPDRLKRQFAGIAAVLEGADREFGQLIAKLDEFKTNSGAFLEPQELEKEIARLRIVLKHDPKNLSLALKLARHALTAGDHSLVCKILAPWNDKPSCAVRHILGLALTELHWDTPSGKGYIEGRQHLESAAKENASAELLCALGENLEHSEDHERARQCYREALSLDTTEPLNLYRYLEFEIFHQSNDHAMRIAEPLIFQAISRCNKQIEARTNVPTAWACLAFFNLLLGHTPERSKHGFAALDSLAHLIRLCRSEAQGRQKPDSKGPGAASRALQRMEKSLRRLSAIRKDLAAYGWLERATLLGLALHLKDQTAQTKLSEAALLDSASSLPPRNSQVVIVSGACLPQLQESVEAFRPHFHRAVENLSFSVVGGGTESGVSGLVGEIAQKSGNRIRAFGYLPGHLPRTIKADTRYACLRETPFHDFSPAEPLQAWTELVHAGFKPEAIRLLAYAGGLISQAECALALAFGAKVGVVTAPGLPPERQFTAPHWNKSDGLARLPLDAMTIRAFLLVENATINPQRAQELEPAAKLAHEAYVDSAKSKDPALASWKDLPEDLKNSNLHQVAYAIHIISTVGLGIRPKTTDTLFNIQQELGDEGIQRLAEMEHGRWNTERLLRGWKYAPEKDVKKKLSPYLVPWTELRPDIKQFDVNVIVELPSKLATVGLEIYKL